MSLQELIRIIIKAFCSLDSSILSQIDGASYYSHQDKQELIQHFNKLFDKFKAEDINSLTVKESQCLYCYPKGNAFSFHHPETRELIIRYVIAHDGLTEDGECTYRVEECRNKPLPDDFLEN